MKKTTLAIIIVLFIFVSIKAQTTLPADYSGIGIAYGLRKLKTNYNGPLIQVAKWNQSTEQTLDIGQVNGQLDLVALRNFLNNLQVNEETYVKIWYDQAGNNINAIQNDRTKAPKIVIDNGPKIFFDGNNDNLQISGFVPAYDDFSLFAYIHPVLLRNEKNTIITGANLNDKVSLKSPSAVAVFGMNTPSNELEGTLPLNSNGLLNVSRQGITSTIYINGVFDVAGNIGTNTFQISELGGSLYSGYFYELLLYSGSSNDALITANIIDYWNSTINGDNSNVSVASQSFTNLSTGDNIIYQNTVTDGDILIASGVWALVIYFVYVRVVEVIKGRGEITS